MKTTKLNKNSNILLLRKKKNLPISFLGEYFGGQSCQYNYMIITIL